MSADRQEPPVPLAEISQGPNAFEEFLDRNQKNIIILAILLVIATAALVIYRGIEKSSQDTAGVALNKADDLATLQAVISEHPDTNAALSAKVLLADRQWTDGQQDAAIETLRAFVAASPDHPAYPAAKASLGSKLMIKGKSEDASRIFQELVDEPKARYVAPVAWRVHEARRQGEPHVVVVGWPEYYPRFGFERASVHGITVSIDAPDEAVMVLALDPRHSLPRGVAQFAAGFGL